MVSGILKSIRDLNARRLETGGPVMRDALYVGGREDEELLSLLQSGPELISLIAPRQTGKTSSLQYVSQELELEGRVVAEIDLRRQVGLPCENNDDAPSFLNTVFRAVISSTPKSNTLGLRRDLEEYARWWESSQELNRVECFCEFFDTFMPRRRKIPKPEIIILDELDLLHAHGTYTDIVFEGLRALFQKKKRELPSFVLSGILPPQRLIKTVQQANFSVGKSLTLRDFDTPDLYSQYIPYLNSRMPSSDSRQFIEAIIGKTGGQPYLTNVLITSILESANLQSTPTEVAEIAAKNMVRNAKSRRINETHFDSPYEILMGNPADALECLRQLVAIHEGRLLDKDMSDEVKIALISTGIVREDNHSWAFKSDLYRDYFDLNWIEQHRQKLSRASYVRSAGISSSKKTLPKVLIINCGGTIGMEIQANGRMGRPADLNSFFKKFPEIHTVARITSLPLMAIDGINIDQNDWSAISSAILSNLDGGYAGVVVCMGTDSMSYAASACAFALGKNLDIPVVFTGAQVPNHLEHSDAPQNLLRSCMIAAERKIQEVCIVYNDSVFRAVRAEKRDDYRFDGFHSPTYHPLAVVTEQIEYRESLFLDRPKKKAPIDFRSEFATRIFKWSYVPGVPTSVFSSVLDNGELQGIVLQTPGVGNVPNQGAADILNFIERATSMNIPVLITSLYPRRPENIAAYEPAKAPLDRGAISAGNMAEPAAITKFMWIIPQVEQRIREKKLKPSSKIQELKRWMEKNDEVGELKNN